MNQHQVQQNQFNRNSGFGGAGNGLLQMNNSKIPKNNNRQQQINRQNQPQPLSVSQLANIQHPQQDTLSQFALARSKTPQLTSEAQYARAQLSSKKCFNLEDDLEFYPNPIDTRTKHQQAQQAQQAHLLNTRMGMGSPISPYSTPTKPVQFQNPNSQIHRMSGYMSPVQAMNSPQQQQQQRNIINHTQIFNSPQAVPNIRRDLSNNSPMGGYQNNTNGRHW